MTMPLILAAGLFSLSLPVLAHDASDADHGCVDKAPVMGAAQVPPVEVVKPMVTAQPQAVTLWMSVKTKHGIDFTTMTFADREACDNALANLPTREPHEGKPRCL